MPSDELDQLLQLVRKCKENQVDAALYRALLRSVLEQTKLPAFRLKNEADKIRPAVRPAIEAEYLELEKAILDENDVLPTLKRLLGRR